MAASKAKSRSGIFALRDAAAKWRCHLSDEARWIAVLRHSQRTHCAARVVVGAKQQVPDGQRVGVVVVGFRDGSRVVPAMDFGAAQEVVQPAESDVAIGML